MTSRANIEEEKVVSGIRYTRSNNIDSAAESDEEEEVEFITTTSGTTTMKTRRASGHTPDADGYYTVEDAVEEIGFGPFQIIVTIFAGMCWLTEAMEVMLLAVLSPVVKCEWELARWQESMLTSVVFVGFLCGGLVWGFLADAIGRKKVLMISVTLVLIFGMISAGSPSYAWLLVLRFITGFCIIGGTQAVTYYVEFLPRKTRGVCVVLLEVWWAVGSIMAAVLALLVLPNFEHKLAWRVYLALCALPVSFVLVFFLFMPESARYYVSKGKSEKGEKVISRIAWYNRKNMPTGRLVSQEEKEKLENEVEPPPIESSFIENEDTMNGISIGNGGKPSDEEEPLLLEEEEGSPESPVMEEEGPLSERIQTKIISLMKQIKGSLLILLINKMWRTTVPLVFIWVGCAWLYYGAVLLTTTVLENGYDPRCGLENVTKDDSACSNDSATADSAFYIKVVWTSAAEFPGIIVTLIIIELIGRKLTMAIEFLATGVSLGLLLICVPEVYLALFLFGARGFATGVFQAVYVYTPEVYPTKIRGSALGLMSSSARIGGLVTPFIAQTLYHVHDIVTILLYVGSCVLLAVLALLLPIETKGRSLKDTKN